MMHNGLFFGVVLNPGLTQSSVSLYCVTLLILNPGSVIPWALQFRVSTAKALEQDLNIPGINKVALT